MYTNIDNIPGLKSSNKFLASLLFTELLQDFSQRLLNTLFRSELFATKRENQVMM